MNPIVLVGAGPIGIEMAVALKRAGMAYVHLEAGAIGATMAWWAPGTRWFSSADRISIAGVPLVTPGQEKATREEYLAYLRGVVQQFNLEVRTHRQVIDIRPPKFGTGGLPVFSLSVRHALFNNAPLESIAAGKIILATGGTAMPNLLHVPGEKLPHVSHYFQDPHAYFGKRVLIVGGRNSAIEAALRCHRAGAKVTLVHHAPEIDGKDIKYWLYPEFAGLVRAGAIDAQMNARVIEITVRSVLLEVKGNNSPIEIGFDFVLLLTGYYADMSLAKQVGVSVESERQVPTFNPATMETNVPGVYMIGTATAGTQRRYKVFLENCHCHIPRVLAHLQGQLPPAEVAASTQVPES